MDIDQPGVVPTPTTKDKSGRYGRLNLQGKNNLIG